MLPLPMPVHCEIYYGEPMVFAGDGNEADEVIEDYVEQVKERIRGLIERGRVERRSVFGGARPQKIQGATISEKPDRDDSVAERGEVGS
jgi:hypothetical protein